MLDHPPRLSPLKRLHLLHLSPLLGVFLGGLAGCGAPPSLSTSPTSPTSPTSAQAAIERSSKGLSSALTQQVKVIADGLRDEMPEVIFIGETHDHPDHHALQALLIQQLRPSAVAFEMLNESQAPLLEGLWEEPPERWGEVMSWEARGWPDFQLYRPVFEAAREVGARLIAAHPDKPRLAPLMIGAPLPEKLRASLKLNTPLPPPAQEELEAELKAAHCGYAPPELLGPLTQAQRLKDAWMARALLNAPKPVVLIVGRGHTQPHRGIPWALELLSAPDSPPSWRVISLADHEGAPTPSSHQSPQLVQLSVPAHRRDDPCERFKGQLKKMKERHAHPPLPSHGSSHAPH